MDVTGHRSVGVGMLRALLGLLACAAVARAQQDVVQPIPTNIGETLQQAGLPQPKASDDPSSISSVFPTDSPFQWPPFVLRPHYLYRFLYGDGIQAKPGVPSTTAIDTFSPGFLLEIGAHWKIDYTPTWDLYSNHAFRDTLGQDLKLTGVFAYRGWTTQIEQDYDYTSQPLIETGVQTSTQEYKTVVDLAHSLSQKFLIENTVYQDLRYTVAFPDSFNWSDANWLHYRVSQDVDTAVGATFGYVHETKGSDSEYVNPGAQFSWKLTSKISVSASTGLDRREFLSRPRSTLDSPTYDAAIHYSPFQYTTFVVDAAQSVLPSYAVNQTTRSSTVSGSLQQRLLGKLFLTATAGHTHSEYLSNFGTFFFERTDNSMNYDARLSTAFLHRGTIAILYTETRNASTVQGFGFSSHQFGMELDYKY